MLDATIRAALRYRALVVLTALAVLIYGSYLATSMPIDVLPDLDRPRVLLVEYPGLAPNEVEARVAHPIETANRGVFGLFVPNGKYEGLCSYGANNGAQVPANNAKDWVFYNDSVVKLLQIVDGTSNTVMFGDGYHRDPRWGQLMGTTGDMMEAYAAWSGGPFFVQRSALVGVNYRITPTLATPPTGASNPEYYKRVFAFASGHTGGANVALCDGSVRFLRDSRPLLTLRRCARLRAETRSATRSEAANTWVTSTAGHRYNHTFGFRRRERLPAASLLFDALCSRGSILLWRPPDTDGGRLFARWLVALHFRHHRRH